MELKKTKYVHSTVFELTLSPISTNARCKLSAEVALFAATVWISTKKFSRWKGGMFLASRWPCGGASFNQPQSEDIDRNSRQRHEKKTPGGLVEIRWPSLNSNVETQRKQTVGRSQSTSGLWRQLSDYFTDLPGFFFLSFWGKWANKLGPRTDRKAGQGLFLKPPNIKPPRQWGTFWLMG